jgi:hypothetical protein
MYIFHSKTVQNLPKTGFFEWKDTIWQLWDAVGIFYAVTSTVAEVEMKLWRGRLFQKKFKVTQADNSWVDGRFITKPEFFRLLQKSRVKLIKPSRMPTQLVDSLQA